jgi:hypothetical protein
MSRALIAAIALLILALGAQTWRLSSSQSELAQAVAQHAQERAQQAQAALAQAQEHRQVEQERQRAQEATINVARTENARLAGRVAELDSAAGRLRQHVVALATRSDPASGDSPPTSGSQAAAGTGLVLAELYAGVDREAVELAEALDRARIAGLACERSYDALTLNGSE